MTPAPPLQTTRTRRVVRSVSWEGRLSLSDAQLRFEPDDPEAPPHVRLDVDSRTLVDARQNRAERLLVVELPEANNIRFVGGALDALHVALRALIMEPDSAPLDPQREISETHLASLRRGPIIHRGVVQLDPEGLEFTPQGVLDTLVGVRAFRIEWPTILGITPSADAAGIIDIHHEAGVTRLEPAAPDGLFPSLLAGLHAMQGRMQHSPGAIEDAVAQASEYHGSLEMGSAATVTLALHGTPDHGYETGVLAFDDASLRWFPKRADTRPVVLPLLTLVRRSGRIRRLPTLRLASGADHHTFVPAIGTEAMRDLWRRVHAPSRVVPWDQLGERTRARLVGDARFVRIQAGDQEPVTVRALQECSADARLVLSGSVLDGARPGDGLRVEVGQDEGVYAFEAVLGSRQFRPDGPLGPSQTTLILESPAPVKVYNQRQGYRAGVSLAATARVHGPSDRVTLSPRTRLVVDDLSIGGCRAVSEAPLPAGATLDLWIDLGDSGVRAVATVLRMQPTDPPGSTAHGLRFEQISAADEDRVHRFVLDRQRRGLQSPGASSPEEPAGPGSAGVAADPTLTIGQDPDATSPQGPAQGPTVTG